MISHDINYTPQTPLYRIIILVSKRNYYNSSAHLRHYFPLFTLRCLHTLHPFQVCVSSVVQNRLLVVPHQCIGHGRVLYVEIVCECSFTLHLFCMDGRSGFHILVFAEHVLCLCGLSFQFI